LSLDKKKSEDPNLRNYLEETIEKKLIKELVGKFMSPPELEESYTDLIEK
jgi:hypothetical protein